MLFGGFLVKKALPPILFFLTIALMIAGLAYRYDLNKTRVGGRALIR